MPEKRHIKAEFSGSGELDAKLAQLGEEAEAGETDQTERALPPHVKVSRPNQARSRVLQVRLNPEEFAAVEAIAAARGLPASTVARERLLAMIVEEQADEFDVAAQIAAAADRIKELLTRTTPSVSPGGQVKLSSPI